MLFGTFYLIFSFSNEDGKASKSTSEYVSEIILKTFTDYEKMPKEEAYKLLDKTVGIVRKIAHYTIYIVVGILLMGLFYTYKLSDLKRGLFSLIIGILYASSDEIHQTFVDGRSGQVKDVLLDTLGVITGIFITMLVIEIAKRIKEKRISKKTKRA